MKNIKKITTSSICSVSIIIGIVIANYSDEIRTSKAGLEIIGNPESCVREPYLYLENVWTDGVGNIKTAKQCVYRQANGFHFSQPIFDTVTSIIFNVGCIKSALQLCINI